ncbi:unnamed protein product [Adineta steineri]|uniref:Uncharacterized protein n=1 Tax=Adineta steineri TaxID=433720 RepID=A0A813MDE8_9BILA|nr:unnamed protein product [Adineta steineri]CAF4151055.1 unnamed protein product [Adineta steineri]
MFGIGRKNFGSSMIPVYLLSFILITNQFLFIHSFVIIHDDQDQNQLDTLRQAVIQRLIDNTLINLEDSSADDDDLQTLIEPTVQRRYCCMNPLSGRKRFIRDLARKQQLSDIFIQ